MATLTFSYDTGAVPLSRIIDAFADYYNYQETVNGQPNPETKAQFARRQIRKHIVQIVKAQEERAAIAAVPPVTEIDLT